jgi:hypothetical protein
MNKRRKILPAARQWPAAWLMPLSNAQSTSQQLTSNEPSVIERTIDNPTVNIKRAVRYRTHN